MPSWVRPAHPLRPNQSLWGLGRRPSPAGWPVKACALLPVWPRPADPKTNPLHEPRFRRREQPRPSRGMERVSNAEHSECWCRGCIRNWCYSFSRSDDRALAQRHRGQGGGPPISTWRAELSRRRQGSFSLPGLPVGAATGSMAKSRRSRLPARSST